MVTVAVSSSVVASSAAAWALGVRLFQMLVNNGFVPRCRIFGK